MINRINLILQAKNITAKQFAEEIGIQPSGMSHIMGGRNNPSLEFVNKVLRRYPELDANWLLLGRGAMYTERLKEDVSVASSVEPTLFESEREAEAPTFSQEPSAHAEVAEPPHRPYIEAVPSASASSVAQEPHYAPAYVAVPPSEVVSSSQPSSTIATKVRHLERVLLIYSDHTFCEYQSQ